jgi:hypothetical protein
MCKGLQNRRKNQEFSNEARVIKFEVQLSLVKAELNVLPSEADMPMNGSFAREGDIRAREPQRIGRENSSESSTSAGSGSEIKYNSYMITGMGVDRGAAGCPNLFATKVPPIPSTEYPRCE